MKKELKYVVNPEKRTVVCIGEECAFDADKMIFKRVFNNAKNFDSLINNVGTMKNIYLGVARCDPRDEFSVEIGKRIARERMLTKYTRAKYNVLKEFEDIIYSLYNNIRDVKNMYKLKVDIARGEVDPNDDIDFEEYSKKNNLYF